MTHVLGRVQSSVTGIARSGPGGEKEVKDVEGVE